MPGYGSANEQETDEAKKNLHNAQINKIDALAKTKAKNLVKVFFEALKEDDCSQLSGAEMVALSIFTGTLLTTSIVYDVYYDLIRQGLQLDKLYSADDIVNEIIESSKHYGEQINSFIKSNREH